MRILIGVTSTTPNKRNPHVVPPVVVSDLSFSRLPGEQDRDGRTTALAARRAAAAPGLLPAVWQPGGDPPRPAGPLVPQPAGGSRLHLVDRDVAAGGMPVVSDRAADSLGTG